MKRKSTIRKMRGLPKTRAILHSLNELESVSKRLRKQLAEMAELEQNAKAFEVMQRLSPEDKGKVMSLIQGLGSEDLTPVVKPEMLKTPEVALMLNVHSNTLRRWSDAGVLPFTRLGPRGDRRYLPRDVENFRQSVDICPLVESK
jgi:transposase-like protein